MSMRHLNIECVWTAYTVTFEYKSIKYLAKTEGGNRGSITLRLDSIDTEKKILYVGYTHNNQKWELKYKSLEKVVDEKINECFLC